MFVKYNAVLRSLSKNDYLMGIFSKLCSGNKYVTTLHVINSGIVKLSKLSEVCTVLPPERLHAKGTRET